MACRFRMSSAHAVLDDVIIECFDEYALVSAERETQRSQQLLEIGFDEKVEKLKARSKRQREEKETRLES